MGLETIEKNMKFQEFVEDITRNHTLTNQEFRSLTAKISERVKDNQTQLKHFIKLAVKTSQSLPKEIQELKKQVESLGAYF